MASAEERQVSLLESINKQMAENKAAIMGLGKQIDKGDKQTSAEDAKDLLKKDKAELGAGTAIGKKETIGQMASAGKDKGSSLMKMLGLGAIGASLTLAFKDEIIGGFKDGMTELFGGKDSLLGRAVANITGLLDELENPLGALATGLGTALDRVNKNIDKAFKPKPIKPTPTPDGGRGGTKIGGGGLKDPGPEGLGERTNPRADRMGGQAPPEKPVARTAGQIQRESIDRAKNMTDKQKVNLEKQGLKVAKDGVITRDGKMMKATEVKEALDKTGAKGPSAKAIAAADELAPKATASKAKVVGPGAAPAATSQVEVDKRMAAKPAAAPAAAPAGPAATPSAAGAGAAGQTAISAIKPSTGGGAAKPRANAFIKIAKKIGSALKGVYTTVMNFAAKAGKYTGVKWLAKIGAKALGPISALITLFMLGKNELDPSISTEEKLKNRFVLLGEAAGGVLGGVVGALVLSIVPFVGTLIGGVLGGIIGAFIGGNLGLFIYKCCKNGVKETVMATFKSTKEIAKKALAYLKEKGIKGLAEDASELIGKGADYVAGLASAAGKAVSDAAGATYDAAAEAAKQAKEFAGAKLSAAGDAIKESAVGQAAGAAASAVGDAASVVGDKVGGALSSIGGALGFGSDKPMSTDEKMAKLDAEIADMEKDVAKDSWHESGSEQERDKKKLESLKQRKAELKAVKKEEAPPPGSIMAAAGPGAQTEGAQAIGEVAAAQAGGGGGTEDALAAIVEQNAASSQAIVQALAKIDAKTGGGGSGMPMMIPSGQAGGQGGLGRKTVIGAPIA